MSLWRSRRAEVTAAATATSPESRAAIRIQGVRALNGPPLRIDAETGDIVAAADKACGPVVLLLRSPLSDTVGVLVAAERPGAMPIGFAGSRHRAAALGCRVVRQRGADIVALRHPVRELYACVPPPPPPSPSAGDPASDPATPVTLDRSLVGGWEMFELEPPSPAGFLDDAVGQPLGDALGAVAAGTDLVAWLAHASDATLDLAGQVVLLLSSAEARDGLADALLARNPVTERLARLWPNSVAAGVALPELLRWNGSRPMRTIIPTDFSADPVIDCARPDDISAEDGQILLSAVRRRVAPTRRLAVLATARNEGVYLLDWLAHHRALGVEHVFLYTNDNTDGSDALLARLVASGVLTLLPQRLDGAANIQRRAYNHALLRLPEILDFRWTAVIDVDEFITLDEGRFDGLLPFLELAETRGADAVALNWVVHPSDGALRWAPDPLPRRFPNREAVPNPHVKTIFRTALASGSTPHAPIWSDGAHPVTLDAEGAYHHGPGRPFRGGEFREATTAGAAAIAHYHLKSLEEYVWKAARARCSDRDATTAVRVRPDNPFLSAFVAQFREAGLLPAPVAAVQDRRFCLEREHLLALPGVAEAVGHVRDMFKAGVDALLKSLLVDEEEHPGQFPPALVDLVRERQRLVALEQCHRGR